MIVEIADFKVEPAKHKDFGSAIRQAADSVLSKATGYLGHTVLACIETEGRYVLTVHWETLDDHTIDSASPPLLPSGAPSSGLILWSHRM